MKRWICLHLQVFKGLTNAKIHALEITISPHDSMPMYECALMIWASYVFEWSKFSLTKSGRIFFLSVSFWLQGIKRLRKSCSSFSHYLFTSFEEIMWNDTEMSTWHLNWCGGSKIDHFIWCQLGSIQTWISIL